MKKTIITLLAFYAGAISVQAQEIPIENLNMHWNKNTPQYSKSIINNEIKGILVEHMAITGEKALVDVAKPGYKTVYLFVKGKGNIVAENKNYEIVPETIFLPNIVKKIAFTSAKNDTIHYLKISSKLTAQDLIDLKEFPKENTQKVYYAKFTDCKPYTEPIKSPNTVSRTILPNKIIPRIAMGTVQTKGPDKVGAHEHPMLEQLFLGLTNNDCVVYADSAKVHFPQYSVLHIPLGSSHSVSVEKDSVLYYVWMDFFLDKKGEEWLKTHNVKEDKK
ncbi:hypothetical protein [Flavobacterium sp. UMI-01]|uniref:hypothetical protein n=1 Tax=Flavobacterium sp. UMI-01 TaxID=1441053 RepID=UPI001C7DB6B4|nr:hypothetical protein [Flavobacterium sp. UMI-01]GIZ07772.1 hypothetical protein FUMI01_04990 [Flavobacterium sp. UMI-01]